MLAAISCGDEDGDGGSATDSAASNASSNGSAADLAADCEGRCADKAAECGAPADVAMAACGDICGMNVTEEQAMCLEESECLALVGALAGGSVCGIGQGGSSTSGSTTNASTSGSTSSPPTTSTTSNPDTNTDGGTLGDPCDCGDPTVICEGTENGCQFSFSGDSYACLVNSGDSSAGVCTQSCDPDDDQCPEGGVCSEQTNYLTGDAFFMCT